MIDLNTTAVKHALFDMVRDQGQDVSGPQAGMCSVLGAHVDEPGCLAHTAEGGFAHGLRCSGEGDDRPVRGFAPVHVQDADAIARHRRGDRLYHLRPPSLAEIRDTFDDGIHRRNKHFFS